jgi:acyl-CoA synthetase (AMP-forming)/AMP-acid ligase II
MADGFEYVELYLAVAKAGLVMCPVNARYVAGEVEYLLSDAGARVLVWTSDLDDKAAQLNSSVWSDVTGVRVAGAGSSHDSVDYETLLDNASPVAVTTPVDPHSLFVLGYTSGTTGRPKGAMLTHRGVLALTLQNAFSFRLSTYPRIALTGSMSFVSVVPAHVLCALRLGGTVTIMGRWEPDQLLDVIERDAITFTYIPSPLLRDMAEAFGRSPDKWRTVESVLHSASRATAEDLTALHSVIGSRLVEGWGMTEHSGGLATVTTARDYLGVVANDPIFASVGRPTVNVDVRVIDSDDNEVAHDGDTIGELVIASPGLMVGYWNNPPATAQALRAGWFHTGDLGTIDARGYVRVSERRTDLIVSGGMNVYPSEVELCIAEIPGVREVAVVGAPHPRWGQAVVAAVVADAAAGLTAEVVIEHCRRKMASYKKPAHVVFLEELPRTTSQKIARAALRDEIAVLLQAPTVSR